MRRKMKRRISLGATKNKFFTLTASDLAFADGESGTKRFTGVAYTGDKVNVCWGLPVVIDLSRLHHPVKPRPVLFNHNPELPVGHFEPNELINDGRQLNLSGTLSGSNDSTRQIIDSSSNGFPWQLSIGVEARSSLEIGPGETVTINGREFTGPLTVVQEADLKEISFVSLGADDNTSATVAARYVQEGEIAMSFDEYVKSLGLDPATLGEEARRALEIAYAEEVGDPEPDSDPEPEPAGAAAKSTGPSLQLRKAEAAAARAARMMEVNALVGDPKFAALSADSKQEIVARARKENLSLQHVTDLLELAFERQSRPAHPGGSPSRGNPAGIQAKAVQAGVMLRMGRGLGLSRTHAERRFGIEATEDGERKFANLSLKGLVTVCCRLDNVTPPMADDDDRTWLRAAFSTASFPRLLEDSMRKVLVDGYELQPLISRQLARKLSVNDFKTTTGYMFTRGRPWEEVAPDGQIKHGDVGQEDTFQFRVKTYGEMIGLTRQMIRNDDLGVFDDFLSKILYNGIATEESLFFDLFMRNDGGFISAANGNLITDPLGIDGLSHALEVFRTLRNNAGQYINIQPRYLLVPPALEAVARQLYVSAELRPGGKNTRRIEPTANIYQGQFEPIVAPILSDPRYATGGVTLDRLRSTWYLLPDPNVAGAFGRAYLDGQETPIVEEVEMEPNRLGRLFRGYVDLGHAQIDNKVIVKSDGTGTP